MMKMRGALGLGAWLLAAVAFGCGGDDEPGFAPVDASGGNVIGSMSDASAPPSSLPPAQEAGSGVSNPPTGVGNQGLLDAGPRDAGLPVIDAASDAAAAPSDAGATMGDGAIPVSGLTPIVRGPAPTKASATAKGPYEVMSYTSGFMIMNFGGGTIWVPTGAEAPFGAVAVCPGFTAAQSSIRNWGPFLASHGIVAITIDTTTPLDPVDLRVEELMGALGTIKSENMRSGSPIYQKIDTMRLGVMGWSMGGGGTWLAAAMHPELRTAITLAGHIITALDQDVSKLTVPTLMFAGSTDTPILGGGMSMPVYDMIPASTPKMVWEVQGQGHNVANDPAGTGGAIGRYGLAWQKVFLEGDERYRQFLLEMPTPASYFKTNLK
jgi:dienelactone hydrolase